MHAFFIQTTGLLQAAPKTQNRLLVEDGDWIARLSFEDNKPDRIRAQIDDSAAR
jgi:hypothetical protein